MPIEIVQFLGAIGEFIGAIAVVVTLIYLAAQVRSSVESAQAAALEAGRTRRISSFEAQRDSPYLPEIQAKIFRGEELDQVERLRLVNHYAGVQLYPQRFIDYIETMIRETDIEAVSESMARAGFPDERSSTATPGRQDD